MYRTAWPGMARAGVAALLVLTWAGAPAWAADPPLEANPVTHLWIDLGASGGINTIPYAGDLSTGTPSGVGMTPEPATLGLLAVGALALVRRRARI